MIILVVEDDPDDRFLLQEACAEDHPACRISFVADGVELLDYLGRHGRHAHAEVAPWPDLIVLDLNLPRLDGREVLGQLKAEPATRMIPVVVLSTSRTPEDIQRCYQLGASGFIAKPNTLTELRRIIQNLWIYWGETVLLPSHR